MKAFKIALIILGPLVLLVGVFLTLRNSSGVSTSGDVKVVDVLTGEVETVRLGKGVFLPATRKDGKQSLYPIYEDENGRLLIADSYRERLIAEFGKDPSLKIDTSSFAIRNGR